MRPALVCAAWMVPRSRKTRQSSAVWFQPASRTNASTSAISAAGSAVRAASNRSEGAIALIVMGVLAEAWAAARDPVGGPVDQARERHGRIAEQARRRGGVDEPGLRRLAAGEARRLAEAGAELVGEPADAHRLRSADVERARRDGAMAERAQHEGVRVA